MKKYNKGLVIGRFQPFHLGHKYLIEKALEYSDKLIIGIGSVNKTDELNPWDSIVRRKMLEEFVKKENLDKRIISVIDLHDHPNDDIWLKKLLNKTGAVDAVFGDNEWVNGILERAGVTVVRVGLHDRHRLEGRVIRKLMQQNKKWDDRVMPFVVSLLEK